MIFRKKKHKEITQYLIPYSYYRKQLWKKRIKRLLIALFLLLIITILLV